MSEFITVDLSEVGKIVGVAEKEVTPPFPNAKPMLQQIWTAKDVENTIKYLSEKYKAQGGNIALLGHVDIWICFAIADALAPECTCFFSTPNHDANDTFTQLPIYDLSFGEPDPALQFSIDLREDGDILYAKFKVGAQIEWIELLTKVLPSMVLPPIPEGKILCISSDEHYPLQWVIIGNYAKKAKAVFTAGHGNSPYCCALPGDTNYKIGDEIPRA